uniref:NADH-ubiquinone oxidoreductase chain 3 n=1 Tax=Villorita cyprinoides TaxID=1176411 RepID=A0A7L7YVT5_9BIVA|nr:NADH dehydrogenase subunit 3 [Villorita cyprinoides]QOD40730.1 NADH dehydrogenase subunit 3 [Villorita cyprinoides]
MKGNVNVVISSAFSLILFVLILTSILVLTGLLIGQEWREEWAKLTSFECGFDALSSSRCPFSLRFFMLALLFLIFDVEMVLILPFIFSMKMIFLSFSFFSKLMGIFFMVVLFLGLVHEYNEGTLDWVEDK